MKKAAIFTLCAVILLFTMTGCGTNNTSSTPNTENMRYTASQIISTIKAAYGNDYYPDSTMLEDKMSEEFPIDKSYVKEMKAEMPTIGTTPDRLVAVVATEGNGAEVEDALNAARYALISATAAVSENSAKINASRVVRNGDYVAYIMLGATNNDENISENAKLDFARKEVNKGVEAFKSLFT